MEITNSTSVSQYMSDFIVIDSMTVSIWLYLVMSVAISLSILANGFVLVVYLFNRVLRTTENSLIANLAISDLLYTVSFAVAFSVASTDSRNKRYICSYINDVPSDELICRWNRWISYPMHLCYCVSVNTNAMFSIHALVSRMRPHWRMFKRQQSATHIASFLWMYSFIAFLPVAVRPDSHMAFMSFGSCESHSADDDINHLYYESISFLLPLVIMVMCYSYSYVHASITPNRLALTEVLNSGLVDNKSKRYMIAVMAVFISTCGPISVIETMAAFDFSSMIAAVLVSAIQMTRTLLNPVINTIFNMMFVRCIIRMLRCQRTSPECGPSRFGLQADRSKGLSEYMTDTKSIVSDPPLSASVMSNSFAFSGGLTPNCSHMFSEAIATEPVTARRADRFACEQSSCPHCNTSMSTRSSVPTIVRLSHLLRSRYSNSSNQYLVWSPTPTFGSGRYSFSLGNGKLTTPATDSEHTYSTTNILPRQTALQSTPCPCSRSVR